MPNLPAKVASALFLGVLASAASTTLPSSPAGAADNCMLEPSRDAAQQGKHWYYRIERGTGRKCWYLREPDDKSARADTPGPAPAEKPAPHSAEATPAHPPSDAHAEVAPRTRVAEGAAAPGAASIWQSARSAAPVAAPAANPAPPPGPSPLAPRWPQAASPAPAASPQPEPSPMVADAAGPETTASTDAAPTLPPPAPIERNTGSLQKLLLVIAGALALASLTGSVVLRLGGRRKRNDWLPERSNWQSPEHPRDPPWIDPQFTPANSNVSDLDAVKAEPRLETNGESEGPAEPAEKIEDFLARLTQQLRDELERTTGQNARAAS